MPSPPAFFSVRTTALGGKKGPGEYPKVNDDRAQPPPASPGKFTPPFGPPPGPIVAFDRPLGLSAAVWAGELPDEGDTPLTLFFRHPSGQSFEKLSFCPPNRKSRGPFPILRKDKLGRPARPLGQKRTIPCRPPPFCGP